MGCNLVPLPADKGLTLFKDRELRRGLPIVPKYVTIYIFKDIVG